MPRKPIGDWLWMRGISLWSRRGAPVRPATWLPNVLGVATALLAVHAARELLIVPAHQAEFFLLGLLVEGTTAWFAATLHMLFLAWLAHASFTRRTQAVWGTLAYGTYWIVTIWVWSSIHNTHDVGTMLLTNSMVSATILALGRFVLIHRAQFDR